MLTASPERLGLSERSAAMGRIAAMFDRMGSRYFSPSNSDFAQVMLLPEFSSLRQFFQEHEARAINGDREITMEERKHFWELEREALRWKRSE